jgi:multidrug efflux pump subunit AcrB
MTASLVAVFIPLLFMGGLIGRLFREFAVTAAVAIVISGLVSLSLTPMMCARMLHHIGKRPPGRVARFAERLFRRSLDAYARSLRAVMGHRRATAALILLVLAASVALYIHVPKGFFPQQDNGLIAGVAEGPSDISFDEMSRRITALAALVAQDPDVEHVYYWLEGDNTIHLGRLSLDLRPFGQRSAPVDEVMARIRRRAADIPGLSLHLQARQDVTIGARVSKTQYQYTLHDARVEELQRWAPRLMQALATLPQLQDVAADLEPDAPSLRLQLDRDAMSRYGLSAQMLDDTLYDAYGQRQVANFYTQVNTYRVILEVAPRFQQDAGALSLLYIGSDQSGNEIPLSAVARLQPQPVPLSINHDGQLPAVTLSFNLAPGYSLGQAVDAVAARIREEQPPLSLSGDFSGTARVFQSSLATQPWLIAAALLAIYIVLGMLYENLVHPITILSTLPSGGLGALLALLLFHIDFSLIALIGVILLIGIVKKNGIMMVDFALAREREAGLPPDQAIYQACLLRFRPIMMTTFAALLGALPLAFGSGAGSELRRPLGVTMVGGLLISQLLTLYTTPVIYLYMHRFNDWLMRLADTERRAWTARH